METERRNIEKGREERDREKQIKIVLCIDRE